MTTSKYRKYGALFGIVMPNWRTVVPKCDQLFRRDYPSAPNLSHTCGFYEKG